MFHCGRRQCRLKANAADPYESARHCRRPHGQEHHDAQGDPRTHREKPGSREVSI